MDSEIKIYLGVDWGQRRIGLALADGETRIATPFRTVTDVRELAQVAREEAADFLILGKPVKMGGESEGLDPLFEEFLKGLKRELPEMEIILVDERLTSQQADKLPGDKKTKSGRDEMAAMIILQNYLDKIANAEL